MQQYWIYGLSNHNEKVCEAGTLCNNYLRVARISRVQLKLYFDQGFRQFHLVIRVGQVILSHLRKWSIEFAVDTLYALVVVTRSFSHVV